MTATYLLDTSIFSQPVKNYPHVIAIERWDRAGDSAVCTSAICLAEVLKGLFEKNAMKYWRRYRSLVEDRLNVLPFEERAAAEFAQLSAEARKRGRSKPTLDLMIASTAKCHGLILATLNVKDFIDIPGVVVEDWTQP